MNAFPSPFTIGPVSLRRVSSLCNARGGCLFQPCTRIQFGHKLTGHWPVCVTQVSGRWSRRGPPPRYTDLPRHTFEIISQRARAPAQLNRYFARRHSRQLLSRDQRDYSIHSVDVSRPRSISRRVTIPRADPHSSTNSRFVNNLFGVLRISHLSHFPVTDEIGRKLQKVFQRRRGRERKRGISNIFANRFPRHVRFASSKIIENLFNPNREQRSVDSVNPMRTHSHI